jgi:hypothetical protein
LLIARSLKPDEDASAPHFGRLPSLEEEPDPSPPASVPEGVSQEEMPWMA